jgi:solute carrier family 25 phosphate transporter 23/24/25/41
MTKVESNNDGTNSLSEDITNFLSHGQKTMISGGIAGCIGKTITAPLSRLTILLQVGPLFHVTEAGSSASSSKYKFSGSLCCATKQVLREEGVLSFWRGNLASVIHRFPYSAINFTVYDELQGIIRHLDYRETPISRFLCGAIAGGVACFACYPLDLVKTQLTVSKGPSTSGTKSSIYGNLSSTIHNIVQQEGVRGLYRGLLISLGVTIPTFGISFCVYGTVKEKLLSLPDSSYNIFKDPITGHLSTYGSMFSGALSGIASSLLLFPMDSIRRRMQVEKILCHGPDSNSKSNSKHVRASTKSSGGAIAEVVRVLKGDGIRGLYRGIVPELLKVTPMVSITFCIYEFIYNLLGA